MNEIDINAKFNALLEQRNNALNHVVNLMGEIAVLKAKIKELENGELQGNSGIGDEVAALQTGGDWFG